MSGRRYVARGVPDGYRIWDNKTRRWWGDLYELCPDKLIEELNGAGDYSRITALLRRYRAQKRWRTGGGEQLSGPGPDAPTWANPGTPHVIRYGTSSTRR